VKRILDADVLIGALDAADAHHRDARALFTQWHDQDDPRLISVVNLAEVLIAPAGDPTRLRTAREAIGALLPGGLSRRNPVLRRREPTRPPAHKSLTARRAPARPAAPPADNDARQVRASGASPLTSEPP
jgi:predicted nucleic acid-binding protein